MKIKLSDIRLRFMSPKERANFLKNKGVLNIGEGCEIHDKNSLGTEPYLIKLGNKVRVTKGVKFITHDGSMWVIRNLGWNDKADKMGKIEVGDNVFIGIETIILPGVSIGSNVIIGAGSIVTKDIPDNTVYAGIPAKFICTLDEYYNKNIPNIDNTKNMSSEEKKDYYLNKFNIELK